MTKQVWLLLIGGLILGALQGLRSPRTRPRGPSVRDPHVLHASRPPRCPAQALSRAHHEDVREARHDECRVLDIEDSPANENTLIYVISHASREQAKANWAAFSADPEWQKISADSQKDGKIVERVESVFVDATDYSPLK